MSQPIIWVSKGGMRLDLETAAQAGVSRSVAQKWIEEERVTVEGRLRPKNYLTQAGEYLCALPPEPKPLEAIPQEIPLTILYEDPYLLVVDKPRGMVVHPAAGNDDGTLVNALLAHCGDSLSGINGVLRPGIVHRIDKDTSGLLVVAKTDEAHLGLSRQLQAHTMEREYHAIVHGHLREAEGVIDAPIGRHPKERKKMAIVPNGRPAVTHYRVLEEYPAFSYIACRLETGRTHQIRVHMASIGHPVAGDPVYSSGKSLPLNGQYLHARQLGFLHPITEEFLSFCSPLPEYFEVFLRDLRRRS
ncbi:MAG: RluA family pseudouridine synthase [Clostridia bacterium]|nr:RluA family pseudouridine synthase [Clostridia bacterium]MBQ6059786.1 RluA family pseudouridine synthase [Clostridia bacterium]